MGSDLISILSFPEFCRCRNVAMTRDAALQYTRWIANNLRGDIEATNTHEKRETTRTA